MNSYDRGLISIIIPCYNEEESLKPFYSELSAVSSCMEKQYGVAFEFLFINDGSGDRTLFIIREFAEKDSRVNYISFTRNFGVESAVYAGLENCMGDFIAVMDADLQHPPSMLPLMYEAIINEGYDCAGAVRNMGGTGEGAVKSFLARRFFRLFNSLSETRLVPGATEFTMMARHVADAVLSMPEHSRFSKGIYSWVGFNKKWLPLPHTERAAGRSKWTLKKKLFYALDGIFSFSTAALTIAFVPGTLLLLASIIIFIYILVNNIFFGGSWAGFPVLLSLICFIGGIQLFCIGIFGKYLAAVHTEVKRRPVYIVKEKKTGTVRVGK